MAITTPIEGAATSATTGSTRAASPLQADHLAALRRTRSRGEEARLAEGGPLVVDTGRHTGRSPKDKFLVREPESEDRIWWGDVNQPLEEEQFEGLRDEGRRAPRGRATTST